MANTTITNLPTVTALNGTEPLLGVQNGSSVQITTAQIASFANGQGGNIPWIVAIGGTGRTSFTANGLLIGNGTNPISQVAVGTTGQVLVGSTGGAPQWSSTIPSSAGVTSIAFGSTGLVPAAASTGDVVVSGTLVVGNGGTGQSSYTIGDILFASGATALSKLADVATGNALISGGVGVAPSYGKIGLTTHVSGILPVANGGTGLATYTTGDLLFASAAGTIASLADVATGNALISGGVGVAPSYGKIGLTTHVSGILPVANGGTGLASYAIGDILFASATGTISSLADVATGSVLVSGGVGVAPAYSSSPTIGGTTTSSYFIANGATTGSRNQGAYAYGTLGFSDQNVLASWQSSVNTYNQILVQNTSSGNSASTAIIIGNNLSTASTYYGEFGMNSSGFTGSGSLNAANAVYLTATTGDLVLGTTTANAIKFVVNSGTTDAMSISSAGAVAVTSSISAATMTATVGAGFQNMVVLTGGASWSLPAALQVTGAKFKITVIGGGGAGGGNPATAATAGGGGGAGGVSVAFLTYVAGQNSVTTSFGAAGTGASGAVGGNGGATTATYNALTYIGTGGTGGALGAATSAGGAGGTGSTGTGTVTLALTGQTGGAGGTTTAVAGVTYINNSGGSPALGLGQGGLMPFNAATGVAGNAGVNYGAGGSGSVAGSTATARAGGNGTAGAIIIEY